MTRMTTCSRPTDSGVSCAGGRPRRGQNVADEDGPGPEDGGERQKLAAADLARAQILDGLVQRGI